MEYGRRSSPVEVLLRAEGLSAYYGPFQALAEVSMEVRPNEITVILGANGAGKSSFLKAISGLISIQGNIWFHGENLTRLPGHARPELGIVHVPEGRGIFPFMTVLENLELGAYPGRARNRRLDSLEDVLNRFPVLRNNRSRLAGSLSGGEQQMLAIGRGLMAEPRLLMLDEPSLGLAPLIVDYIFEVIGELNRGGITILLVEQLVGESLEVSHQAYLLSSGKVVASGDPETISKNDQVRSIYLGLPGIGEEGEEKC